MVSMISLKSDTQYNSYWLDIIDMTPISMWPLTFTVQFGQWRSSIVVNSLRSMSHCVGSRGSESFNLCLVSLNVKKTILLAPNTIHKMEMQMNIASLELTFVVLEGWKGQGQRRVALPRLHRKLWREWLLEMDEHSEGCNVPRYTMTYCSLLKLYWI